MPRPNRGNYPNNNAYRRALANYERKGKAPASPSVNLMNVLYETDVLHKMNIPNLEGLMKVSPKMRNLVGPILRNKIRTAKTLMSERAATTRARREALVAQLRRNPRAHEGFSNNNKKFLLATNYASMRQNAYNKGLQPKPPAMGFGLAPAPTTVISQHPFRGYTGHMRRIRPHALGWLNASHYASRRNNRYRSTGRLTAEAKRYHRSNASIAREFATRWLKKVRARKNT
jgi:hypothetical protein